MTRRDITIGTEDGSCTAALIGEAVAPHRAGVILFMDAFGPRQALDGMADRLSKQGYLVLVPDLFYRSGSYGPFNPKTAWTDEHSSSLIKSMLGATSQAMTQADTKAFIASLTQAGATGPIGCVGYCMGGGRALNAAAAYPERIQGGGQFSRRQFGERRVRQSCRERCEDQSEGLCRNGRRRRQLPAGTVRALGANAPRRRSRPCHRKLRRMRAWLGDARSQRPPCRGRRAPLAEADNHFRRGPHCLNVGGLVRGRHCPYRGSVGAIGADCSRSDQFFAGGGCAAWPRRRPCAVRSADRQCRWHILADFPEMACRGQGIDPQSARQLVSRSHRQHREGVRSPCGLTLGPAVPPISTMGDACGRASAVSARHPHASALRALACVSRRFALLPAHWTRPRKHRQCRIHAIAASQSRAARLSASAHSLTGFDYSCCVGHVRSANGTACREVGCPRSETPVPTARSFDILRICRRSSWRRTPDCELTRPR